MGALPDIPHVEDIEKVKHAVVDLANKLDGAVGSVKKMSESFRETAEKLKKTKAEAVALQKEYMAMADGAEKEAKKERWRKETDDIYAQTKALKDMKKEGVDKVWAGFDKIAKSFFSHGWNAVSAAMTSLYTQMKLIYDLQERWTAAIGAYNMKMGATGKFLGTARGQAMKWEGTMRGLTDNLGEGLQMMGDFQTSFGRIFISDAASSNKEIGRMNANVMGMARGFGVGVEGATSLIKVFTQLAPTMIDVTKNGKELNEVNNEFANLAVTIKEVADKSQTPISTLTKDLSDVHETTMSLGKGGVKSLAAFGGWLRKAGTSLKQIEGFTKLTDTFEGSAQAMAKLNTVFGTSINAFEVMLQDDPGKRLELVRDQLNLQGKSFESLGKREKQFFAETMGVDQDTAAAFFKTGKSYEEFEKKQNKAQKEKLNGDKLLREATLKTAQTQMAMSAAWDHLTKKVSEFLSPFFKALVLMKDTKGPVSFTKAITAAFKTVENILAKIGPVLAPTLEDFGRTVKGLAKQFTDWVHSDKFKPWIAHVVKGFNDFYDIFKTVFTSVKDTFESKTFQTSLKFILDHIKGIAAAIVVIKGAKIGKDLSTIFGNVRAGRRAATDGDHPEGAPEGGDSPFAVPKGAKARLKGGIAGVGIGVVAGQIEGAIGAAFGQKSSLAGDIGSGIAGGIGGALAGPIGAAAGGALGKFIGDSMAGYAEQTKSAEQASKGQNAWDTMFGTGREAEERRGQMMQLEYETKKAGAAKRENDMMVQTIDAGEEAYKWLRKNTSADKEYAAKKKAFNKKMKGETLADFDERKKRQQKYDAEMFSVKLKDYYKEVALTRGFKGNFEDLFSKALGTVGGVEGLESEKGVSRIKKIIEEQLDTSPKASGGIVTSPRRALIGESGPEAVLPLRAFASARTNVPAQFGGEAARKMINKIAGAGSSGGGGSTTLVAGDVYLDGRLVGRHVVRQLLQSEH